LNEYECPSRLPQDFNGGEKTHHNLPPFQVSAWNAPAVVRAPHSAGVASATSTSSTDRLASDRTIYQAEPCFITKISAYTHQQVHWINAITGQDDEHVEERVAVVVSSLSSPPTIHCYSNVAYILQESFLLSQGIVGNMFSLDDAFNLVNSELGWLFLFAFLKFSSLCCTFCGKSMHRIMSRWTNMQCSL
jgi:hypothetical protein